MISGHRITTSADVEGTGSNAVQLRRWTRDEYERLGELGILGPEERVELIDGEILTMPPQLSRHASGVYQAHELLHAAYTPGFIVRSQLPLALGQYSEPEPDVAVIRGVARDFAADHPSSALLVVEVSDSTLAFDREVKASLDAAAGIPEYWIVNLVERQLEIHREPGPMPAARLGYGYGFRRIASLGEKVSLPGLVGVDVEVNDFLPEWIF